MLEKRPRTEADAAWIHGQPMKPCPKCGSFNLMAQTPIRMEEPANDSARALLAAWARAKKGGATPLEGPVYMMCRICFHKGPSVDCTGRTSEDVGKDPKVASEIKRLWNEQEGT